MVLGVGVVAGGVDEEDVAVGLALVEEEDGGGDAGAEEEIGGKADDGFEEVFLDELLADATRRSSCQPRTKGEQP